MNRVDRQKFHPRNLRETPDFSVTKPAAAWYRLPWNSRRLLKIAAFTHSDSCASTAATLCRA